jgi:hypothetical protein
MKLSTPITVQIEDAEVAVALWHFTNQKWLFLEQATDYQPNAQETTQALGKYFKNHISIGIDVWSSIDQQLKAAKIDPCAFKPEEVSKQ